MDDYDGYIQELTSGSIPLQRAEHIVAEALCEYMNDLADNADKIYEQALRQRCQEQDKIYANSRRAPEKFPLELFTSNIKTNKLDAAKWNATIQDYLLERVPLASSAPHLDKTEEMVHRLSALDREIHASFPSKKDSDRAPDNELFAPLIPAAFLVGPAIAHAVGGTVGVGVALHLHNKKKQEEERWVEVPYEPGTTPVAGPGRRTGAGGGQDPPPPPPPVIPGTSQGPGRKGGGRDRKRRPKGGKDDRRKARRDYYFGYVDRVEPAGSGFEIRVEAIAENSLSDEVFLREIQKLAAAAGSPSFGRYRLALVSIFVHSVPPRVEVGTWINFKVDTKAKTPATKDSPDVSGTFTDGVTLWEPLEPRISFLNLSTECYFADNDGYIVQTDVKTISRDIPAHVFTLLRTVFGTFNSVIGAIKGFLTRFMIPDSADETTDSGAPGEGARHAVHAADLMLAKITRKKKPGKQQHRLVYQDEASVKDIKAALFRWGEKKCATKYNLYDVGQGHSGRVFSGKRELFANDFGYGRVGPRRERVCSHMIKDQGHVPVLLSHWDMDHYRIAKSSVAKAYSGTADDVTRRYWVAPGGSHIEGPITHEFAWSVNKNRKLLQWPEDSITELEVSNVTIVSCERNNKYSLPDKNNFGALSLMVGTGDDFLVYPGDANFESIPGIEQLDGKVRTLIATHHGSTVALDPQGACIPGPSSKDSYTLFSYAQGNTYGHDVKNAFPIYEKAGYALVDATETFATGEDTFQITHLEPGWWAADNSLLVAGQVNTAESVTQTPTPSVREVRPGLEATSMPQPSPHLSPKQVPLALPRESTSAQFPHSLTLTGSGGGTAQPDRDDLLQYGIKDEFGDIVIYDITATKIVLEKLPLVVPCNTDYPVTVQISCQDIEIRSTEVHEGFIPLVRFDVASGFEWTKEADPSKDGQHGNPGFAGGRLRLAVAGDWSFGGVSGKSPPSGLSIQYRGGKGGSGQKGGAGTPGSSGQDGGVVFPKPDPKNFVVISGDAGNTGPTPKEGTDGGNGGKGGDAGAPGTIANSEVLAVTSKWPAGWKVTIDLGKPGTDSEYGKTSPAGRGGAGGRGGKGSKYTDMGAGFEVDFGKSDMGQRTMKDGRNGQNGADGREYDGSKAQFRHAKVNLGMVATEDQILREMAPADWRFYAD